MNENILPRLSWSLDLPKNEKGYRGCRDVTTTHLLHHNPLVYWIHKTDAHGTGILRFRSQTTGCRSDVCRFSGITRVSRSSRTALHDFSHETLSRSYTNTIYLERILVPLFFFLFNISTKLFVIKVQLERMIFITSITYFVTQYIVPFKDTCFFNPLPYKLITIIAKRYKRITNKNCKNRS